MATLSEVLKAEVTRLARRATKGQFAELQKRSATYRREIAALKREIAALRRELASGRKRATLQPKEAADDGRQVRFQVKGLVSDRKRLGLSAGDYGRLVGVSGQTIYNWESKKASPRRAQVLALSQVRGIGKREAASKLAELAS